jgi:predicted RNase H-like HicB family nuclease
MNPIILDIIYDDENFVYYASSEQVRGLHVEAETIEDVLAIATDIIPELIAENTEYDLKHGALLCNITNYAESHLV